LFKNLTLYRIGPEWPASLMALETSLAKSPFLECGSTQPMSCGWVPPRGKAQGALVETVGGHWLLAMMVERKLLPAAVVRRRVDELAAQVERDSGRKPGKTLRRELQEQATLELLPRAFTKRAEFRLWIDPEHRRLMVDAGSAARADEVVAELLKAVDGLALAPLQTAQTPAATMADWLLEGEPPAAFTVDRECELKADDESKAVVRYARHRLDTDEVREHIKGGKRPTRLALTWQGRVSFVLNDAGQIRRIAFLDVVFENRASRDEADDGFDADAAIATGELSQLIPELLEALGGEQVPGESPAAPADTALERLAA
jgi:recombination associated protein RdgC